MFISNMLDMNCQHQWRCITRRREKYSLAPILYVNEVGVYQCAVVNADGEKEVESHYIEVLNLREGAYMQQSFISR